MEPLRRLERGLLAAEKWALVGLLGVMVTLSFLQVLLRGAFSAGLLWADTLLRHLVLWVGFLGASVAAGEGKQFAMDATARALSGRLKAAAGILVHLFTAAVCALMARASWTFLAAEYADWARDPARGILFSAGPLRVPGWVFELILPAGFALLALHYLLRLAADGHALYAGDEAARLDSAFPPEKPR